MAFPEIHPLAQPSYETAQWENLQFKERGGTKKKMGAKRGTTYMWLNLKVSSLRVTTHDLYHIAGNRSRV